LHDILTEFGNVSTDTEIEVVLPIIDQVRSTLNRSYIERFCREYSILTTDISFNIRIIDDSNYIVQEAQSGPKSADIETELVKILSVAPPNALVPRIAEIYNIDRIKQPSYRIAYGYFDDGVVQYPFAVEILGIPLANPIEDETKFIGAINYTLSWPNLSATWWYAVEFKLPRLQNTYKIRNMQYPIF
jgi:hypothetical protein